MKMFWLVGLMTPLAVTSTPVNESDMLLVHIDCETVGLERANIATILEDADIKNSIAELEALRGTDKFDRVTSETLMQLKVAPLNLEVRDAIQEHGEFLCNEQNGTTI